MKGNRRTIYLPIIAPAILAGVFTLGLTACSESDDEGHGEQKITMEQVPAAVKATLDQARKGGYVKEVGKITADGKTVYLADIVMDGKEQEILVAEDGKVIPGHAKGTKDND